MSGTEATSGTDSTTVEDMTAAPISPALPTGPGPAPLAEVADLRIDFPTDGGTVRAVDGVGFTLRPGEALGLVGESGSGKSATAYALLGMHRGTGARVTGTVRVAGTDVLTAREEELRRLRGGTAAIVFQDPLSSLDPYYAVGDQIAEVYRAHHKASRSAARGRAVEVLDRVGIPSAAKRARLRPHEFSGGMRQRALIAMALACQPQLLIADEPTTALDVTVQAQILDLLHELREAEGLALLLVTHDLGVTAASVDRLLVLQHGLPVESGPMAELLGSPRHPYTRALLSAVPRLDGEGPAVKPVQELAEEAPAKGAEPEALGEGAVSEGAEAEADGGRAVSEGAAAELPSGEGASEGAAAEVPAGEAASEDAEVEARAGGALSEEAAAGVPAGEGASEDAAPEVPAEEAVPEYAATEVPAAEAASEGASVEALGEGAVSGAVGRTLANGASGAGAASGGEPLLEAVGLRKEFGRGRERFAAVDGVSLTVAAGETLGVVGESGSGKTTLGRMLVRLLDPTAGAVRYRGRDIAALRERQLRPLRRELQMVFQDPVSSLNPRRSIGESIADPLRAEGRLTEREITTRVGDLLERVGLDPAWYHRYPHEFSGGQRQRVGIARALAPQPRLIVCDEPVSALDVTTQAQVVALLGELKREFGVALVFVAHDLAVVRQVSDRVAVMRSGRVVEEGTAEDVYGNPQDPYTKGLLAAVPVPDPTEAAARRTARKAVAAQLGVS
ncbi:peptide/nickel transport system ATP-binding protein [Actinacidiphila guanduensis]|uniref:Peptide/nickel transport system ATP-binding protein n=2 Tax=Actinacidiphila guanduensis TaxID=310781 RepID=A0A1H0A036_9ACTN|nr:dipeptide ABC transporter ATP-binding protein [Actinacidiphila guanduensis]SDN26950.1 peptide/nickel transport system ATP-binding protein [Actinacidiphila guanduensis]